MEQEQQIAELQEKVRDLEHRLMALEALSQSSGILFFDGTDATGRHSPSPEPSDSEAESGQTQIETNSVS